MDAGSQVDQPELADKWMTLRGALDEEVGEDVRWLDAGESGIEALEFVGKAFEIDTEEVEHGGVEVVHGSAVFHGIVAELIGRSADDPAFDSRTCHPDRKRIDVVIASGALAHRRAAEFPAPDDQGVIEHPALFEIFQQRGRWLVGKFGGDRHVFFNITMVIPSPVVELDEADSALEHSAG